MQGNPTVINALNEVYHNLQSAEEQAHLQEHAFEVYGWSSSKFWDDIENNIHKECTHYVLCRIFELGGRPTGQQAWEPIYWPEDFGAAINETITSLQRCREAYVALCGNAEDDGDRVTCKMAYCHMKWLESRIVIFEGLAIRFGKLGTVAMTGVV